MSVLVVAETRRGELREVSLELISAALAATKKAWRSMFGIMGVILWCE